mgnify:CR=1 FL=1
MKTIDPAGQHLHFVTGRLAEHALRATVEKLSPIAAPGFATDLTNIWATSSACTWARVSSREMTLASA